MKEETLRLLLNEIYAGNEEVINKFIELIFKNIDFSKVYTMSVMNTDKSGFVFILQQGHIVCDASIFNGGLHTRVYDK